jgi:hypothetical protein
LPNELHIAGLHLHRQVLVWIVGETVKQIKGGYVDPSIWRIREAYGRFNMWRW